MGRHSRNNTASASFTKAEYGMLRDRWGSKKVKLGAESFRQFDQCTLCLNRAESPVVCSEGHVYCKECIYTSLLDQKKEIGAIKMQLIELERDYQAQRDKARAEAMDRVQRNFESVQTGALASKDGKGRADRESPVASRSYRERSRSPNRIRETSLKDLPDRIKSQTERAIREAMQQLDREHLQAKKDKIPAYWLPSLTPSADTKVEDVVRQTEQMLEKGLDTKCYAGDKYGHAVSIKSLVDVRFVTEAGGEQAEPRSMCPSCKKGLNSVGQLYVLRGCGHVHCSECVDILLRPALKKAEHDKAQRPSCLECSKTVKSEAKDVIALRREGTGFASAGGSETKKQDISFQG